MPVTPNGRYSPNASNNWDLITDLAAMQVSNETASANEIAAAPQSYRSGTNAQRLALTSAQLVNGLHFYAHDTGLEWVYRGNTWYVYRGMFFSERGGAQNFAAGWSTVSTALGTPNINDLGTWNTSTGTLTLTRAGLYRINAGIGFSAATPTWSLQVTKNSTTPDSSNTVVRQLINSGANTNMVSGMAQLAAGDAIRFLAYSGVANSVSTTNGPSETFFALELIR